MAQVNVSLPEYWSNLIDVVSTKTGEAKSSIASRAIIEFLQKEFLESGLLDRLLKEKI
jgi:hypothetical protein